MKRVEIERRIKLNGREISYTLRKSSLARRLSLIVRRDGQVVVVLPWRSGENYTINFLKAKAEWLLEKIDNLSQELTARPLISIPKRDYPKHKEAARRLIEGRLSFFANLYGLKYKRVFIRAQKTRWGSCSRSRNLNFNFKILFLPPALADYIIVHELCHLKEFNHSPNFWKLVSQAIPDYKARRKALRGSRLSLI